MLIQQSLTISETSLQAGFLQILARRLVYLAFADLIGVKLIFGLDHPILHLLERFLQAFGRLWSRVPPSRFGRRDLGSQLRHLGSGPEIAGLIGLLHWKSPCLCRSPPSAVSQMSSGAASSPFSPRGAFAGCQYIHSDS